ncbi:MAG: cytochrome c maturation protein CcmE [Alphaproteobacteria bacterium]
MKPKHQRLLFIIASMIFLIAAALLTMQAFKENLVFFFSPSELAAQSTLSTSLIRVGGLVETGSIKKTGTDTIVFTITDGKESLAVQYTGLLPTLFREGQGVVAEGHSVDKTRFNATRVLTKHDENYMPKEVVDSLKKTGHWQKTQ